MIDKSIVKNLVDSWLDGKDYFLTDLTVSEDGRIVVEIDHQEGVWIEDCVELSRHIEAGLNRDEEDFELEVGSAGLGQPFKVLRQYEIHLGDPVDVLLRDGKKLAGTLVALHDGHITLSICEKVKLEGEKRPKMREREIELPLEDIKETRYHLDFK